MAKSVLITRNEAENKKFATLLRKKGFNPIELPLLKFNQVEDLTTINYYLDHLEEIDWIVFTSATTVEFFFEIAHSKGVKFYFFPNLKIATVGEKTKMKLELLGYRTNFVPIKYTAQVLAENLDENIEGKKILIPQSNLATDEYTKVFIDRKAIPIPVVIYQNTPILYSPEEFSHIVHSKIDYLTFTSGSAFNAFKLNFERAKYTLTDEKIISIGPSTSKIIQAHHYPVHSVAQPHTIEGIIEGIEKLESNV